MPLNRLALELLAVGIIHSLFFSDLLQANEPPALNPFAPRATVRDDAFSGFAELSDGSLLPGDLYVTRDVRLKIHDVQVDRQREVPLRVVQRIDCTIVREWMEREWRFKENANDVKVYTGRTYPARLYEHTITLHDGRKIKGPLSAVVYIQPRGDGQPRKLLLHKRHKGALGSDLESLTYVRTVQLGDRAYEEAAGRVEEGSLVPARSEDKP